MDRARGSLFVANITKEECSVGLCVKNLQKYNRRKGRAAAKRGIVRAKYTNKLAFPRTVTN